MRKILKASVPASFLLCVGCQGVGQISGTIDGYRFGQLRSAYFEELQREESTVLTVFMSDYEYSCADMISIAQKSSDDIAGDNQRQVGLATLNIVGAPGESIAKGLYPISDHISQEGKEAILYMRVVQGEGYGTYASTLGISGAVDLVVSRGVSGNFEMETEVSGSFSGSFAASLCEGLL